MLFFTDKVLASAKIIANYPNFLDLTQDILWKMKLCKEMFKYLMNILVNQMKSDTRSCYN